MNSKDVRIGNIVEFACDGKVVRGIIVDDGLDGYLAPVALVKGLGKRIFSRDLARLVPCLFAGDKVSK